MFKAKRLLANQPAIGYVPSSKPRRASEPFDFEGNLAELETLRLRRLKCQARADEVRRGLGMNPLRHESNVGPFKILCGGNLVAAIDRLQRAKNAAEDAKKAAAAKKDTGKDKEKDKDKDAAKAALPDLKTIEATILEVLPKGLYRLAANRAIQLGPETPFIAMEGHIREREIGVDDTVQSDALLNIRLDIYDPENPPAKKPIAAAPGKEGQKK